MSFIKLPKYLYHGGKHKLDMGRDLINTTLGDGADYGPGMYLTPSRKLADVYVSQQRSSGFADKWSVTKFELDPRAKIVDWHRPYKTKGGKQYDYAEDFYGDIWNEFGDRMGHPDDIVTTFPTARYMRMIEDIDGFRTPNSHEPQYDAIPEYVILNNNVLSQVGGKELRTRNHKSYYIRQYRKSLMGK